MNGSDDRENGSGDVRDDGDRSESSAERVDRELIELLNELRVALSGTTVLFAFLLTIPFSQTFARVSELQRSVYFATFLLAAMTSALLMAPTSYHRLRFREHDKEQMLRTANRLAIGGVALLAASMGGAVYLIADLLYGSWVAAVVAGAVTTFVVALWFILPLARKAQHR